MHGPRGTAGAPWPDPAALHRSITALARPRLAGSEAARQTLRDLHGRLLALGYAVCAMSFSFSAWPGLYGVSALGGLMVAGLGGIALLVAGGWVVPALTALVVVATLAVGALLLTGRAIARLPLRRMSAENLLATPPGCAPKILVVAHVDSKSQGVPTLARTTAAVAAAVGWVGLLVVVVLTAGRGSPPPVWVVGACCGPGILGGVLLFMCRTGDRSPGALDNATGLAALLALAERFRWRRDVAFLVTDAEELGLAGARAAAVQLAPPDVVINLDGLDDNGPFLVLDRWGLLRRRGGCAVATALREAGRGLGISVRSGPSPPGILCDHVPFAAAGVPAVTVMRGTLRSLSRVHRPADRADRLTATGAAAAVVLVASAVDRLLEAPETCANRAGR